MQITTDISSLHIAISENTEALSNEKLLGRMMHAAERTDWNSMISKIDRRIARAGAFVLVLSILYLAPILVSMLLR